MEPTPELAQSLWEEEVRRARAMTPEERLLAGPRLFDMACRIMADGIRDEFPDADENRVQEILRQRLELARKLEVSP
jgi:hypothetical protein